MDAYLHPRRVREWAGAIGWRKPVREGYGLPGVLVRLHGYPEEGK